MSRLLTMSVMTVALIGAAGTALAQAGRIENPIPEPITTDGGVTVKLVPVATGLVADDEIANLGPLNRFVSSATASQATGWHKEYGSWGTRKSLTACGQLGIESVRSNEERTSFRPSRTHLAGVCRHLA